MEKGMQINQVEIVDSHTGGEPTRVVLSGGPDLGNGPLTERKRLFQEQHDDFRKSVMREPRGNDVIVGALLCEPHDPDCDFGVVFFNNVGYIGMCGHGTIGLVTTLNALGRVSPGTIKIDTVVGKVEAVLHEDNSVSVTNVPSYRYRSNVEVEVPRYGLVMGDIAWGGNWFFLCKDCPFPVTVDNLSALEKFTRAIRLQLDEQEIRGENGGIIDHIEVFGAPQDKSAHSKNFVLCPGGEFDRSPCGTGTSAKIACLYADNQLAAGDVFVQESIIGSLFEASFQEIGEGKISPTIRGRAHIHAVTTLTMEPGDPFRLGIEYPAKGFQGPNNGDEE